jgi:hypothetical protein
MSVTIVTALFDINREKKGDGRKVSEYLEWFRKTLQLNCKLFIVTEEKFHQFIIENRPKGYPTYIKTDGLGNSKYYKYLPEMKEILESEEYKKKISCPNRVECKLPEYNVIQYSKFGWLENCMELNPFDSEYFLWMDAGISRFFLNVQVKNPYPSERGNNFLKENLGKFIIQRRRDLEKYKIDENFMWGAENLLKGTMFGGNKDAVSKISKLVEEKFLESLKEKKVNNEQLVLTLVWNENKNLFKTTEDSSRCHLILFKKLSM